MSKPATDFWLEFIKMYKESPCLWDQKCANYKNSSLRNIAYGLLIEKIWEINENANLETVRRKLGFFNSKFVKEMKKKKGKKNFKSNWIYFRPLSFLASQDQSSGIEEFDDDATEIESDQMDNNLEPAESIATQKSVEVVVDEQDLSNDPPEKKPKLTLSNTECTATDTNKINSKTDSTFVEYLTTKMQSFDPEQKHIAEKLILDVMFMVETKQFQ